jgi:hypothetical protein
MPFLTMKTSLLTLLFLLIGLCCFGQEIEFSSSLNTSTEQRFQNAYGIGLQYQHNINSKYKVGLGIHYNFNNVKFDEIPYVDGDPNLIIADKIHSYSKRFSIRLNIQRLLKNNENSSISLGPEISYNYLWGKDQIEERQGQTSNRFNITQNNGLTKEIGIGLITKLEIKKIISPLLSLCFTIRPEIISDGIFVKGENQVFSGVSGFTEFQIGLKYKLMK